MLDGHHVAGKFQSYRYSNPTPNHFSRFLISQMGLDFVRQHSGSGDDDENLSNLASSRLALEAHAETGYGHSRRPRQRDSQRFGQEETARIVCKYLFENLNWPKLKISRELGTKC